MLNVVHNLFCAGTHVQTMDNGDVGKEFFSLPKFTSPHQPARQGLGPRLYGSERGFRVNPSESLVSSSFPAHGIVEFPPGMSGRAQGRGSRAAAPRCGQQSVTEPPAALSSLVAGSDILGTAAPTEGDSPTPGLGKGLGRGWKRQEKVWKPPGHSSLQTRPL